MLCTHERTQDYKLSHKDHADFLYRLSDHSVVSESMNFNFLTPDQRTTKKKSLLASTMTRGSTSPEAHLLPSQTDSWKRHGPEEESVHSICKRHKARILSHIPGQLSNCLKCGALRILVSAQAKS